MCCAADLAHFFDGFGERELFAGDAGDEAAAADLAAGFEPAVAAGELAPRRGVRLAGEEAAEDDSVAAEERPGLRVEVGPRLREDRPAAGAAGGGNGPGGGGRGGAPARSVAGRPGAGGRRA